MLCSMIRVQWHFLIATFYFADWADFFIVTLYLILILLYLDKPLVRLREIDFGDF